MKLPVLGFSISFKQKMILPYFVYRRTVRRKTKRVTPLIEEKYDEIYLICEKGNKVTVKY